MITRTTPKPKLPKQQPLLPTSSSSVTPLPHHPHQKGPSPPSYSHLHKSHLPTTATIIVPPSATKNTSEEDKKEKTRQYNKAHREKLKRDGKFEEHKERVRKYNAKRRQTLNTMAKENGLSVRKMEQTLKETKKNTGVDLLSIAINNGDQTKDEKKEEVAQEEAPSNTPVVANTPVTKTPQQQVDVVNNAVTTPKPGIPAAQAYLAQRCQPPQPSPTLSSLPTTSKNEEKKELTKAAVATAANTVITPSTTPPPSGGIAAPIAAPIETEKQKKSKHNQHNRAYRDKLKQDKRRYEEHKEKARQYNEKRRKKLRAMAKESGLTMKEMEKTIKEAKIISALTVTASKEAQKFTPVPTPHLIGVSPPPPYHQHHHQAIATNCLDILSDAASIVLSQSHHHHHHQQQQQQQQHSNTFTPSSPRRQHRTVSEDNYDSPSMEVNSN